MKNLWRGFVLARSLGGGVVGAVKQAAQIYKHQGIIGVSNAVFFLLTHRSNTSQTSQDSLKRVSSLGNWLGDQVRTAALDDPRITLVPLQERLYAPLLRPYGTNVSTALEEILTKYNGRQFKTLIVVPVDGIGGADKVARTLAKEIADQDGSSSVLLVETFSTNPGIIDDGISGYFKSNIFQGKFGLSDDEKIQLLLLLVENLNPTRVININSEACWNLFCRHFELLKSFTQIAGAFFCADYDANGFDRGYSVQYFSELATKLDYLISDNGVYISQLCTQFQISETLLNVYSLYQPMDAIPPTILKPRAITRRPVILWAARICRQKGIEIVPKVAELCPDMDFHIFGSGWKGDENLMKELSPSNVYFHGSYNGMHEAMTCEPDIFLHTALWDGIPNTLLEVGARGVPIISSAVGAIPELAGGDENRLLLVTEPENPRTYVEKIRKLVGQPTLMQKLVTTMTNHLNVRHSHSQYSKTVAQLMSHQSSE